MLRSAATAALIACATTATAGPNENFLEVYALQNLNQNDIYRVLDDGTTSVITPQPDTLGIAMDVPMSALKYLRLRPNLTQMELYSLPLFTPAPSEEFTSFVATGGAVFNFGLALDPSARRYYFSDNTTLYSFLEAEFVSSVTPVVSYGFTAVRFEGEPEMDRFVVSGFSAIATGNLDGTGLTSRGPVGPIITASGIDPLSGDVVWAEGDTVYRTGPDLMNPQAVLTAPEGVEITCLDVYGDLVVYSVTLSLIAPVESRIRLWDGLTDSPLTANLPDAFYDMEMRAEIIPPPVAITQQPDSVAVDEGLPASLGVMSGDPTATFQWRRNGTDLSDDARVSGSTTATLSITPTEAADSDVYTCVVTTCVPETVESDPAYLAVRNGGSAGCPADVNNDGLASPADFTAWLAAFQAGCP